MTYKLDFLVCESNQGIHHDFFPSLPPSLPPSLASLPSLSSSSVLECVQLTEPGMTTLICSSRETLIGQPICTFIDPVQAVPCKR